MVPKSLILLYVVQSPTPVPSPSGFVVKKGCTVEEFAGKVHKDFSKKLKTARIWGTNVYDGQMVGRDHVLHDKDVVELQI